MGCVSLPAVAEAANKERDLLIAAEFRVFCDRYDDPGLDRGDVREPEHFPVYVGEAVRLS